MTAGRRGPGDVGDPPTLVARLLPPPASSPDPVAANVDPNHLLAAGIEAADAARQVSEAAATLGRVRDVTVEVRVSWQQLDDLAADDAARAELTDAVVAVAREWAGRHAANRLTDAFNAGARVRSFAQIGTADLLAGMPALWHLANPADPADPFGRLNAGPF